MHCGGTQESMRDSAAAGGSAVPAASLQVAKRHFQAAMRRVTPSVSRKDQRVYNQLKSSLCSTRGRLDPTVRTKLVKLFCSLKCLRTACRRLLVCHRLCSRLMREGRMQSEKTQLRMMA